VQLFKKVIAQLKQFYGKPELPPAQGPFELVLWENACYLLPDERRFEVFDALSAQVGLNAKAILAASGEVLLALAKRGGMRPETRVFRWRQIASLVQDQYGGDLDSILTKSYAEAKRALKQFPNIGDPGSDKILLFCGMSSGMPLESNGLRVLTRLGWGRAQRSYGATYRSVQDALKPELPPSTKLLQEAHLLLRIHGKTICKDSRPLCHQCPLSAECAFARTTAASFLRETG
jgi:endonuclease-3